MCKYGYRHYKIIKTAGSNTLKIAIEQTFWELQPRFFPTSSQKDIFVSLEKFHNVSTMYAFVDKLPKIFGLSRL